MKLEGKVALVTGTSPNIMGGIAEGLDVGSVIARGEHIAYVGDSGTPESVTAPDTQVHLHFEIRIGESYLGAGLEPDASRALYEAAFIQ